jgi:hypothetical protein
MVPAVDDRLLPDQAAALAQNTWAYNGDLVGVVAPALVRDVTPGVTRCYRIPDDYLNPLTFAGSTWMDFADADTDVIRSPVVGDTFDRYYWISPTEPPKVNSLARIKASSAAYPLGVPAPADPPVLFSSGGTSAITVTRSYVVTWVTAFNEEGPPSPPVVHDGLQDDTWALTLPVLPAGYTTDKNITKVRIYRTVTAVDGTATYYFVAERDVATTLFNDNAPDSTISGNAIISSTDWSAPPAGLQGWVTMPNGMIAGWLGSEVWFCEPYRPHAWPAKYAVAVEYPVIGLGVINQTLVICTAGYPVTATGINPGAITLSKISSFEPCLSRGSIVSAPEGVYYASPNGLVLVANGVASNVTQGLFLKDGWNATVAPAKLRATKLSSAFYGWEKDTTSGSIIDLTNQRIAYNELVAPANVANVFNDSWSNDPLFVRGNKLYRLDLADAAPTRELYTWVSKNFQVPDKKNLAAIRVYFKESATPGASIGTIKVYADGVLKLTRDLVTSAALIRMPSGFKADFWQVRFESVSSTIYSFQMATSVKELVKV